jgi:hypothetical protein
LKHVIVLLILAGLAWHGYGKYQQATARTLAAGSPTALADLPAERPQSRPERPASVNYHCDGRIYCSQMKSCEEATWFLRNCPGTKMDGNNDGIPCERQWCN